MPKRYTDKELIKMLEEDGWYLSRVNGSHHIFNHNIKSGTIVVPCHRKEVAIGTSNAILKKSGLKK